MTDFGKNLRRLQTPIPGLEVWDLPVHGDSRGWFKENWQREKMTAAGLPDFGPVQNNISFNDEVGTTRGIHAEPWDKWVSMATGRIFGAWVDLRRGPTFGAVFTAEIDPSRAVFVPRGVGNAFQTLERGAAYVYLVNDHWSPELTYKSVNVADEALSIPWPIPLDNARLSTKDLGHPRLSDVEPIPPRRMLILGASGQLGTALRAEFGDSEAEYASRRDLDLTDPSFAEDRAWADVAAIINAAAYTDVDGAETSRGRSLAWDTNVVGLTNLVSVASRYRIPLIHISSDYVFDGELSRPYREDDRVSPMGVYAQTKAAGDAVVSTLTQYYIVRTSWVIGAGRNFVSAMRVCAEDGVNPRVVDDQVGRLTFADTLARGIRHLLETNAEPGIYNITNSGEPRSWAEIATEVFRLCGHDPGRVQPVPTAEYHSDANDPVSPRPRNSVLDLGKIESTGFHPEPFEDALRRYLVPLKR